MYHYFTSDLHFGHGKIIEYSNRPFKNNDEMNSKLIKFFNERVRVEDTCYIVGDFCFKSGVGCVPYTHWLNQLNGNKILIKGNHDKSGGVKTLIDSLQIRSHQRNIHVCHKPEHTNPKADLNIVGHVHEKWRIRTFAEHYSIINSIMSSAVPSDKKDWENFLITQYDNRHSESVLFNCGVDVNNYRPIELNEIIGQISKWKNLGCK